MKCFYHSADLDGHCSGVLVKMKYPDCELIGINYGDDFPWDSIETGELIYMVDFSLQPYSEMNKLNVVADTLIWIDHHKSAIEEENEWVKAGNTRIMGIRNMDKFAGCELTWKYFYPNSLIPTFVALLGRYDIWDHSDPRTLSFQYGMRQFDTIPENNIKFWKELFDVERVNQITEQGGIILKHNMVENEKYIKACGFKVELDGLKCIAANKMLTNSMLFTSAWDPEKYHAMLTFGYRKGKWTVSLYSDRDDVDVSAIAKNRGGGGHKGAAGFQIKNIEEILKIN